MDRDGDDGCIDMACLRYEVDPGAVAAAILERLIAGRTLPLPRD